MPKVWKFSGPPQNWITAITIKKWAFNDDPRNLSTLEKIKPNDIAIFHSTSNSKFVKSPISSIVGYGIIGYERHRKSELLWIDEIDANTNKWPNVIDFEQIYTFSNISKIDTEKDIINKTPDEISREISELLENALPINTLHTEGKKIDPDVPKFPLQSSVSSFNEIYEKLILNQDKVIYKLATMKNKYCRICWNTSGWRYPTGDAKKIETTGSYTLINGFGHEEWLFNYEWLIEGYRYGFLQPIGRFYDKYKGQHCSVLLYTVTPEAETLIVARIDNVYIPTEEELKKALDIMIKRGWIQQMRDEVDSIGGNLEELDIDSITPRFVANIRFKPRNVTIFDPRLRVVGDHKILRIPRYQPLDWDDDFPPVEDQPPNITNISQSIDPQRSERERTRSAQEACSVDPRHIRLQNNLYQFLCDKHGSNNVDYEKNFVDLSVVSESEIIFYEIKMESTVKKCIRLAIGQLLEYSHYPDFEKANRIVVVGDCVSQKDDLIYLNYLRNKYDLPIYYAQFNWEANKLEEAI